MTNFEKWAKNPDFGVLSSVFREADNMSCSRCPAKAGCPMWNDDMSRGNGTLAQVCKEAFEKWANAKAERTTPRRRSEREIWKCMASMTTKELYAAFGPSSGASNKEETK